MDNSFITPEDFLLNNSFIQYCIGNDEELVALWDNWINDHPEKSPAVLEAKRIFSIIAGSSGNVETEFFKFSLLLDKHIQKEESDIPHLNSAGKPSAVISIFKYWKTIAAVLLICSGLLFWFTGNKQVGKSQVAAVIKKKVTDALPGKSQAKLIMADGSVINLDSLKKGHLKEKDGTEINKSQDVLVYSGGGNKSEEILFNTLSTPRGGEYQLVLPDGSKVWLNAASSIRFPLKFTEKSRTVYLTGEAYFEVTKNLHKPFQVELSNGLQVEVLGTQFNVMNYDDEASVKTTLVEGKIKMTQAGNTFPIKPSQQAVFTRSNNKLSVMEADVDKEIAWKTGHFEFDDEELPGILRQLSRWYDVEVAYSGALPDKHYSGAVSKQLTLMQVLEILRLAGIQYSIENKKLLIKKI